MPVSQTQSELIRGLGSAYFTGPAFLGSALEQRGELDFFHESSAFKIAFQSGINTADVTYVFPTAVPAGNNYALVSSTAGVLSWFNSAGTFAPVGSNFVTIGTDATLTNERALTGTANQVVVTDNGAGSTVVLSTPQNIDTAATPTFASETLTATSNQLVLGTTRTLTITAPTPATSSRTWTIPDISSAGTFAALEGTQTFSGTKTFSAQLISSVTSNNFKLAASTNNVIITVAAIGTADRTISIPDPGTNANFVLSEATATINGTKTFAGQLIGKGTATNDNAAAGYMGEIANSSITAFTNFPATGVIGDLTSISLTAGDWDVSALAEFTANGATSTSVTMGIDTVAGNSGNCGVVGVSRQQCLVPTAATDSSGSVPAYRISVSGTTTVYLKYTASYTIGTPQAAGSIRARRAR